MPGDSHATAIEVFARAFASIRSRTYPYSATLVGNIWVLQDDPHRTKARAAELISANPNPENHTKIGDNLQVPRWNTAVILTPAQEPRTLKAFKQAGFRRISIEPFFTLQPEKALLASNPLIQRVQTAESAELVRAANQGRPQIKAEHLNLDDAPIRLYAAIDNNRAVGWVSAHKVEHLGTWVSNLYVQPDRRKQGLGAALMSALLADDARLKTPLSVLTASHLGTPLYPKLGYTQVATLHLFRPPNYARKPRELCL